MQNELIKTDFDSETVALIKKQLAPNASDSELKLFLYQCKRTGLDPLVRQIYCIHRGGKMTIQTSIDGFRVIAERSGDYGGQDEPIFNEVDGKLISCKITVYRFKGDIRYPAAVGVAYMSEYNAGGPMWNKMPHTMLSKCAEAVALRKAYPQDLSGLYTGDEMEQSEPVQIKKAAAAQLLNGDMAQQFNESQELDEDLSDVPDEGERQMLRNLVYTSTLSLERRQKAFESIDTCSDFKTFELIQNTLENEQAGYDDVANPNSTDAKKMVKKIVGKAPVNA